MKHNFLKGISLILAIMLMLMIGSVHFPNNVQAAELDDINCYSVLVLDVSPSMCTTSMNQMKETALKFSSQVITANGNNYVAIIAYSQKAQLICDFSDDLTILNDAINKVDTINRNGTNTYAGLLEAQKILSSDKLNPGDIKNIVLMTDGIPNYQYATSDGPYAINDCNFYELSDYSYRYANAVYNLAQEIKEIVNIYTLGFFQSFNSSYPNHILNFAVRCLQDVQNRGYYEVIDAKDLEFVITDAELKIKNVIEEYYMVTAIAEDTNHGFVTGECIRKKDDYAQVNAVAYEGYTFEGWYVDNVKISSAAEYSFLVETEVILVAKFIDSISKYDIQIKSVSTGNGQANVDFDIVSANGKGYTVYLSESKADGTFKEYKDVNYNSKGVHIKKLTNGVTYYVYIDYKESQGNILQSEIISFTPCK